ncbi:hypothetical protein DFAR_3650006 [Desulfarculales bacterium]
MLVCFFSIYGLLRKRVAIDAVGELLVETALLTPAALACLWVLEAPGQMAFFRVGWHPPTSCSRRPARPPPCP